jgi:hypothetical protein
MATVPFNYECDRDSAFIADPNARKRFGYITELDGLGLADPIAPDLTVSAPYIGRPAYPGITLKQSSTGLQTAKVVGVVENLVWQGGVGDAIKLEFWCSQENAATIKALQQSALKPGAMVNRMGWWIADYDQEDKKWFEQSHPASSVAVTGLIAGKENPELNVDLTPIPVNGAIDVNLFKVSISVAPAPNLHYALHFANSASMAQVKSWGIVVGTLASEGIKPIQP